MSDGTPKQLLPRLIDPRRFAQQGVVLRGPLPVAELHRLKEIGLVVDSVQAELFFAVDQQREKVVSGQLQAEVQLQCQRCLDLMPVSLVCDINLALVRNEEDARHLPGNYDPWISVEEQADLYALLEEEILLNLPYVVYHETPCGSLLLQEQISQAEQLELDVVSDKPNPFQVLKQLKEKTKK
jgi:uncharacterized protein